ncbi:MAG: carbon storage regulator CsrA, partial [Spirochaetota bacterium]
MLILARRINESIVIGDDVRVSVIDIKGDQIELGIEAPRAVKVYRQEVYEAIQEENREAARTAAARTASTPLPSLTRRDQSASDSPS